MEQKNIKGSLLVNIILVIISFLLGFLLGNYQVEDKIESENESSTQLEEELQISNNFENQIQENNVEINTNIEEYNHVDDVSKILDDPKDDSDLVKQKEQIIKDEREYGDNYMKFTLVDLYSRKPDRIIFKQGNKDGFYIFEKNDKAYEHLLVVSEDRMSYSIMSDYNLWCFTPDSINQMTKSGENYIIYDFDNENLNVGESEFQKDIIFRFNSGNRLYRLVSYLSAFKEPILKDGLGKEDFATNTEISGYKYMMYQ